MKKRKDTRSFGTLIGTFNTRYFTLDLGNMAFTYRKNEQSTKVKYFPLDVSNRDFEYDLKISAGYQSS